VIQTNCLIESFEVLCVYKWLNQVFYILQVFNDPTALTEDDLYDLRNRWATCFLDLYHHENDYDDVAEEGS
jgi:hypothetical protein